MSSIHFRLPENIKKITFRQPETVKISMFLHGVTKVFKMNILFIADPLSSFKTYKDTTYAMMREMAEALDK